MVTPSTNPPQFRSSRSAGSHVPGKAVLSKAEAGKRNNIKNLCPILSCRQGVAHHCPLGSCRSCSCPWETRPAGGIATRRGCHFPFFPWASQRNPSKPGKCCMHSFLLGNFSQLPYSPEISYRCHKVITTDLEKASSDPRISHPRLQDPELIPADTKFPDTAQPQDPSRETCLPRMKVKPISFLETMIFGIYPSYRIYGFPALRQ